MLRFEDYTINSAQMLEDNPLPDIKNNTYLHAEYGVSDRLSAEEKADIGKGMLNTILPYKMQDNYTRDLKPKTYKAAILENEYLKAVFLPELGGRLWSLFDKKENMELLYVNKVFQPGNLALRNAWFSGGVEWNVGIKGHNPLTCDTLFAQSIDGKILRMYEYERIRDIVYSIEATLDKDKLFIKINIENTSPKDKYMYWWSNIAVIEEEGTRVIVPSDEAFCVFYNNDSYVIDKCPIPVTDGVDISYTQNLNRARDFFHKIPKDKEKWITSLSKEGKGLCQMSSPILFGRKTFLWGMGKGGYRWNEWLSHSDERYIEIQAGLRHTQYEHFVMKANSNISWYECYTSLCCDPQKAHSRNWQEAKDEAYRKICEKFDISTIDTYCEKLFEGNTSTEEIIGSGWGYVENVARKAQNLSPISSLPFGKASVTPEQEMWLELSDSKTFPCPDTKIAPSSYLVNKFWLELLESSLEKEVNRHWYTYYQLGVMYYAEGNLEKAKEYFEKSSDAQANAWAYRCLCYLYKNEFKDNNLCEKYLYLAMETDTEHRSLYLNYAEVLCYLGRYEKCIEMINSLKSQYQEIGRMRLYKAIAYMNIDKLEEAKDALSGNFVMPDIKEGEISISDIWFKLYTLVLKKEYPAASDDELRTLLNEKYPLPHELDFRMS